MRLLDLLERSGEGIAVESGSDGLRERLAASPSQRLQDIGHRNYEARSVLNQPVGATTRRVVNRSGNREDLLPFLQRVLRGDQGAAPLGSLYHQYGASQTGDDPVALWEVVLAGRRTGRELANQAASLGDPGRQVSVLGRVSHIEAATQHGDRIPSDFERRLVGDPIDAPGESADDDVAGPHETDDEGNGRIPTVAGVTAGTDDGYGGSVEQGLAPLHEQHGRRLWQGA